jgi:ankyrin repeat protein
MKHRMKYLRMIFIFIAAYSFTRPPEPKPSPEDQLTEAAYLGSLDTVKQLVAQGVSVNAHDSQNLTPLMEAARGANLEIVEFLISKGADVNLRGGKGTNWQEEGATPLRNTLIEWGNLDNDTTIRPKIVKLLLDKGADANAKINDNYGSALAQAAFDGSREILEMLIAHGADANDGKALTNAIEKNYMDIFKYLLSKGASINDRAKVMIATPDGQDIAKEVIVKDYPHILIQNKQKRIDALQEKVHSYQGMKNIL